MSWMLLCFLSLIVVHFKEYLSVSHTRPIVGQKYITHAVEIFLTQSSDYPLDS